MQGYTANIEHLVSANPHFRQVLYTSKFCQLVVMILQPAEEIGMEVHDVDQFFRFESGTGSAVIDSVAHPVGEGTVVIVPAGAQHNIINTSSTSPLQLYTLYCPPHHQDQTLHPTKAAALSDPEHFDGHTTES